MFVLWLAPDYCVTPFTISLENGRKAPEHSNGVKLSTLNAWRAAVEDFVQGLNLCPEGELEVLANRAQVRQGGLFVVLL